MFSILTPEPRVFEMKPMVQIQTVIQLSCLITGKTTSSLSPEESLISDSQKPPDFLEITPPSSSEGMQQSIQSASMLTIAMAITIPLGLITKVLIPRYLGSEQAGHFFFATTFPTAALALMPLGLGAYIKKTVPPRPEHVKEILRPICFLQAGVGALLLAGVIAFMLLTNYSNDVILLTTVMGGFQAFTTFQNEILHTVFFALGFSGDVAKLNVIGKIITSLLIGICLIAGGKVYALALFFLLGQVITTSWYMLRARSRGLLSGSMSTANFKQMFNVSLPFFIGALISSNNNYFVDTALLSRMATFKELGYYGAASGMGGVFMIIAPLIGNALVPNLSRAYHHDRAEYKKMVEISLRLILVIAMPLSLGIMMFAPEIIGLLYGPDFKAAETSLMVQGALLTYLYFAVFTSSVAVISTRGRRLALITGSSFLFNALFDFLIIPKFSGWLGEGGAAAGSSTASLVSEILTCIFLMRLSQVMPLFSRMSYTFLITALPPFLIFPLKFYYPDLGLVCRCLIYIIFLPSFALGTRIVTREELKIVYGQLVHQLRRLGRKAKLGQKL